jgi:hypothetical protein
MPAKSSPVSGVTPAPGQQTCMCTLTTCGTCHRHGPDTPMEHNALLRKAGGAAAAVAPPTPWHHVGTISATQQHSPPPGHRYMPPDAIHSISTSTAQGARSTVRVSLPTDRTHMPCRALHRGSPCGVRFAAKHVWVNTTTATEQRREHQLQAGITEPAAAAAAAAACHARSAALMHCAFLLVGHRGHTDASLPSAQHQGLDTTRQRPPLQVDSPACTSGCGRHVNASTCL